MKSIYAASSTYIAFVLGFIFLLPNLFIFSTDDMAFENKVFQNESFSSTQGVEGRYTLVLMNSLFNILRMDVSSYKIISIIAFCYSLVLMYYTLVRCLKIGEMKSGLIGFIIFLSFGLSLDMYQYVFAYLPYGLAMICVAGAVSAATRALGLGVRLSLCTLLAFAGFGAYQVTGVLLLISASVLVVVPRMRFASARDRISSDGSAGVLLTGTAIGATLYALTNAGLRSIGVSGFVNYPAREQGLRFVIPNLPRYVETLDQLITWDRSPYGPLLPVIWRVAFAVAAVWLIQRILRIRATGWVGALAVAVATVAAWPDPANLLLGFYWPSARSMAGFGLFFAILCAASCVSVEPDFFDAEPWRFRHWLLCLVAVGQCVTAALRYQDRLLQQVADIALAQSILLHASEIFPIHDPIHLRLGIDPAGVGSAKPLVYDYGRSLFATPWSAPALIEYLSGHRVSAEMAVPGECKPDIKRVDYRLEAAGLLVCIGAP